MSFRQEKLEEEFQRTLNERISYPQRLKRINELCNQFGESVAKEFGVKTLSNEDRQAIRSQMEEIPFDLDSNAFLRLVISELSFCCHFGQKRSNEICIDGCHYTGYFCYAVQNCVSNRFPTSVRKFSQALAWLLGDDVVDLEHLRAILPFTLAHRIQWRDEVVAQKENDARNDPLNIHMEKVAVREMHRRYMEQGPEVKEALAVANRIAQGEALETIDGDHPIYSEIRRDIGVEI